MKETSFLSLFIIVALFACGCAKISPNSSGAAITGNLYVVATKSTGFYHYNPHQEVGPDKFLPKDTVVTLIRPSFGFSSAKLMNGEEGYVSSKDLRVAPAELVAAVTAAAAPTARKPGPTVQIDPPRSTFPEPPPPAAGFEPSPLPSPHSDQ